MAEKIVTNLRIDKDDWLQIKVMAAELGMSTNEYIAHLIQTTTVKKIVGLDKKNTRKKGSIWDLAKIAKMESRPMGELSEEDKIIYGLE